MAVHVIPYNPWREQLALTALGNVAGDIIGDLWKSHRQNEQNRKANAFRGQLRQNLQNNSTQQDISLIPKEAPNGYNANPWAAAFHQDNSPLTQFDFGTSSVGKTPTLQDIANTADNLAATKRFSMLDTKTVNDIRDNFMQQSIGDMFANAGDIQGQMNTLTRGAAQGFVAPQVLTAFSPYAMKILSPYTFHESLLGKNNVISALNEITGEANPAMIMPVSVSPDTEANNQASRDVANINAGATQHSADRNAEASMFSADRNFDAHVFSGNSTVQAHQLDAWQKMYDALKADIQADYQSLDGVDEKIALAKLPLIKAKEQRRAELLQRIMVGSQGEIFHNGQLEDLINTLSEKHNVDPDLIAAIVQIESAGKNGLTSSAGAQGLMQIMPSTQKYLGITDPWNPVQNIDGGIRYFKEQLDRFGGNIEKALRAYNAGPGNVPNRQMPKYKYVQDVMAIYNKRKSSRKNKSLQSQQVTPQSSSLTQNQTIGQTPATSQDIKVMQDNNGNFITQSELDKMIDEGAKHGYGVVAVKRALREKGYRDIPEKRNFEPNLNWYPSYMGGGFPQGDASTSAPMPNDNIVQKFIPSTNPTVTALTDSGSREDPFARPYVQDWHEPLNPAPTQPVNAVANPWSYVQERPQNSDSPFWRFTDWLDFGYGYGNDIVPQSVLFSDPFYYSKNKQRLDSLLFNYRR